MIEDDLITVMDQRIRAAMKADQLFGTVVTRASAGPAATVQLDGSTVPIPVKCLGHVFCQPQDRVGLIRWGSDWLIVGSYSGPGFGEASRTIDSLSAATGQLTSSTFVDLTEFGTLTFTKFYDNTYVDTQMSYGGFLFSGGTNTRIAYGLRFAIVNGGAGYIEQDYRLGYIFYNVSVNHQNGAGRLRILGIPAGTYTVSVRWRRSSGTGSGGADQNDFFAVGINECVRASAPIL